MTKLSPAAEAVLDAALPHVVHRYSVAAALRAAADQVVPWQPEPTEGSVGPTIDYGYAWALFSKANDIRQELIAIADELEGAGETGARQVLRQRAHAGESDDSGF